MQQFVCNALNRSSQFCLRRVTTSSAKTNGSIKIDSLVLLNQIGEALINSIGEVSSGLNGNINKLL